MQHASGNGIMTNPNPYASAHQAREARVQVLRLRRRASQTEAVVRAAILAAALATLAVALNGVLHTGSRQVASSLDAATGVTSVQ
jgi:hypothetical protein